MFQKSAALYDAIYAAAGKDYAAESAALHLLIQAHRRSPGNSLLDVACGTGAHLEHLQAHCRVEGIDLDPGMLDLARQRLPLIPFHQADMVDFDLGRRFDAVVCLFSSIGYVKTVPRLRQALRAMARHTVPGGVVAIEPWLAPGGFIVGHIGAVTVDRPDLKIARMNVTEREGNISIIEFHYLVAAPGGVEYFTERHELGLFTEEEYIDAFRTAGLDVVHDGHGLSGRGLYLGSRPVEAQVPAARP